ncbi:MAG: hypothetical protein EU535_08460 [Promethearchaeota archaeon]|nr:MAG: hypothetical protein EU535_08460 [Candidatus Lokiarchaeota archaeon]
MIENEWKKRVINSITILDGIVIFFMFVFYIYAYLGLGFATLPFMYISGAFSIIISLFISALLCKIFHIDMERRKNVRNK